MRERFCRECKTTKGKLYTWIKKVFSKRMNKNYFYETSWCKKCSSEWFKKYTQTPNGRRLKAKHRKLWKQTPAGKISTKKTKTKYSLSKQNKIIS